MVPNKLSAALLVLLMAWFPAAAHAEDDDGRDLLKGAIKEIQEMLDRFGRIRPKPEGFVEPPDAASSERVCRLEGTVRVGERPLAGCRVSLLWVSQGVAITSGVSSVTTADTGAFVFPRVPLGTYRMIGEADEGDWDYRPRILLESPGVARVDVILGARKLQVTVLGQDLKPVVGAGVSRENPIGTFMSFAKPDFTNADGKATIVYVEDGFNEVLASVGDVSARIGVYGLSDAREVRMILPPLGTVELSVKGWDAKSSHGFVQLSGARDGNTTTLLESIDASGRAVLRCSPGPWVLTLTVMGEAATPSSSQALVVRAGEVTSIELPAAAATATDDRAE